MKLRTLLSDRHYFGLDPQVLRAATGRALARVVGLPPDRARISVTNLRVDFAVDTVRSTALVDAFVAGGLLEPPNEKRNGYAMTPRFAELASARIVAPLARSRARWLVGQAMTLAGRINLGSVRNPLEISGIAVYGEYMSRAHKLDELLLGVVVRSRSLSRRARFGRMQAKTEGAEAIRVSFRELSSFVRVRLVTDAQTLPRPFSLVLIAD